MTDDPFDLLGLEPAFDLDPARIESAYLSRVARLHPDMARGDPDATARSAALNHARQVLDDPEQRASALLARLGGDGEGEGGGEPDKALPDGFLMQIMEVRESLAEAQAAGDAERLAHWSHWAEQRRDEHIAAVARLFNDLTGPPSPDDRKAIQTQLNAWRYIERMLEQMDG